MKKILVAGFASLLSCVNQYSAPKQYDVAEAKIKLAQCLAQEAEFLVLTGVRLHQARESFRSGCLECL